MLAPIAKLAADIRWAGCEDRTAATAAARAAFLAAFERQVDPDGRLHPDERARLAEEARKAHYADMARKSAAVRRAKAAARKADANA